MQRWSSGSARAGLWLQLIDECVDGEVIAKIEANGNPIFVVQLVMTQQDGEIILKTMADSCDSRISILSGGFL
jgi:hypothetical protein